MQLGSLNLNTANALDGADPEFTGGQPVHGSRRIRLGRGRSQLNGGKMFLRQDAGVVFGGTINVTGIGDEQHEVADGRSIDRRGYGRDAYDAGLNLTISSSI